MALTQKQEGFSLAYHKYGKQGGPRAYAEAGYSVDNMLPDTIYNEVWRLLQNPEIAQRLKELQEEDRERNAVTVESITLELEKAREKAMGEGKGASAAVSASLGKAKLHGLLVDRIKVTEVPLADWKEEDIDARIGTLSKETGIASAPGGKSQEEAGE